MNIIKNININCKYFFLVVEVRGKIDEPTHVLIKIWVLKLVKMKINIDYIDS